MTSTTVAMRPPATTLIGALYVLGAGLSWSFTGALLRFAPHIDAWQIQTYRGLGTAVAFWLLAWQQGRPVTWAGFVVLGRLGPIVTVSLSVASIGFIVALKLTTVANALFLSSCSPLLSATLGYMILRERLSAKQTLAVALGFAGLLTIVGGGFEAGNGIGNIAAILSALGFASAAICMRLAPSSNFNPAMVAFGLLSCAVSAGMCIATGSTLLLTPNETLVAFASGFVLIGGGFALYLRGAPWVPAVGQTVLAQTETVFGPIWVWLAFGEAPASTTLIGGAIILIAVLAMAMTSRGSVSHLPTSEL